MQILTPHELEPGMIVAETILTPSGQVLATEGAEVTRQLINRMKLYRVESAAVVGEPKQPDIMDSPAVQEALSEPTIVEEPEPAPAPKTQIEETKTAKQQVASSDAFQPFQMQYFQIMEKMKTVFKAAAEDNTPIDTDDLLHDVANLFVSRRTIIALFDMLNHMRSVDDSVYANSINAALVSRMIGRWLKMDRQTLNTLTIAGLLHDIGKIQIPNEILNKPDKLTDEEYDMIKSHAKIGYNILKKQDLDPRIKKAALMHHERCDGSGYPSNLEEDLIDDFAMIVGIADVYDAMTAARAYRAPLCAFQVIYNFEKDGLQKYNTKFMLTFLKQIAATYQSNRVILNDGRGGKIVMLNPNDLSRPVVQFDDNTCLDLSKHRDLFIKAIV